MRDPTLLLAHRKLDRLRSNDGVCRAWAPAAAPARMSKWQFSDTDWYFDPATRALYDGLLPMDLVLSSPTPFLWQSPPCCWTRPGRDLWLAARATPNRNHLRDLYQIGQRIRWWR